MLNSKQLLTGLITLMVLLGVYFGYNAAVGPLTDFDPIEPELLQPLADDDNLPIEDKLSKEPEIAAVRGFGPNCKELSCLLKIEYRDRKARTTNALGRGNGLHVFFDDYEVFKDDPKKIRAHPISLVYIAKSSEGESADEISTVRGDEAIIEFDRPVDNLTKIQAANPIAGEIRGKIVQLKNNRKSADPEDDIVLFTEKLVYSEAKNLIWAPDAVRLSEKKIEAIGYGLELELYPKDPPGQPKVKRKSQAREVRLMRGVRFDLKLDDDENFLGANAVKPAEKANVAKKPPMPVVISARGAFAFNLETNRASFSKSVQVVRKFGDGPSKEEKFDQLECDDLVLQFEDSKETEAGKPPTTVTVGPNRTGREIKATPAAAKVKKGDGQGRLKLTATTATGKQVILLSDGEKVQANGNYLFHDAVKKQTTLKGDREMIAIHENAVIHASTLNIQQGDEKGVRHFVAEGPDGWLEILEDAKDGQPKPADGKQKTKLKIRWQGKLVMAAKPGSEEQIVTITNDVELDDERIALKCDKLRVWLVPADPGDANNAKPIARSSVKKPEGKLEPVKIEAEGRVAARSDDWDIFTQDLTVNVIRKRVPVAVVAPVSPRTSISQPLVAVNTTTRVKDQELAPPKRLEISAAPKSNALVASKANNEDPKVAKSPASKTASAGVHGLADAKPRADLAPEPKTPLEIRATRVALVVEREGTASRPISAWAEGEVLVTQSPKKPTDEPLEIRGQTLQFERKIDGDQMRVSGQGAGRLASIKTADVSLFGHRQIFLDEVKNEVHIPGQGYIIRETANDLSGKRLDKPQLVRIDWEGGMDFDGKLASFRGVVRAQQATAEVASELMDVTFDQRVDFKEAREKRGSKERPKTQIDRVDCDRDVVAIDIEKEGELIVRQTVARGKALLYDNQYRNAKLTGPGDVTIVDRSSPKKDAAGKIVKPEHPYERTEIKFDTQMTANKEHQTAKFYENVRILRAPVDGLDNALDPDHLTRDGVAINSNGMVAMALNEKTNSQRGTKDKYRDFQAQGDVRVQGQDYFGACDQLSYDEEKDLMVLSANQGRTARFFRQLSPGDQAPETAARTIWFWRKAGRVSVEGVTGFQYLDVGRGDQRTPPRR